jgi:formate dehydrogenase major subunit
VFLPAASSFEKDGTFMNAERRVQRVRKVIDPIFNSKSDWEIICLLARALGKGEFFNFDSAEAIWNEIRSVWIAGNGITYERLETAGLQWPCDSEQHPGTSFLHAGTFSGFARAGLRRIDYKPTEEKTDSEFPFLLTTGRTLYQFNAGTMTLRTRNVELRLTDYLDISAEDASELGIVNGDRVQVQSRDGEAILPARISPSVRPGELFATFHTAEAFLNRLTGPYRDSYVDAPEYKVTAVRVERL